MSESVITRLSRPKLYWGSLAFSVALILLLALTLLLLFWNGIGLWDNNIPVTWALDIVSYDWWIGIACGALLAAGTLTLMGNPADTGLRNLAAGLAVFAAAAAAIYPIIHLGRPWFFYWTLPTPNSFGLWPQVRSPLFWDAIDILAFLGIAAPFWYLGLLPSLARLRDCAFARVGAPDGPGTLRAQVYGIAAIGWRGAAAHWGRWLAAHRVLASAGIGEVVVLQTGAAIMFSGTLEPGWHDTLMPAEFVGEAALAGLAVLTVLATAIRLIEGGAAITQRHLDGLAWAMLAAGAFALYCFAVSQLTAEFGGDPAAVGALHRRLAGPHAWSFWLFICAGLLPAQLFWLGAVRRSAAARACIGLLVAAGIWAGHFMVIVGTLQQDFLPTAARPYHIGVWGWTTFGGTGGLFLLLVLVVLRVVPVDAGNPASFAMPETECCATEPEEGAPLWGVSAEFLTADAARAAWKSVLPHTQGRLDALSPAPLMRGHGFPSVFTAALLGFFAGFSGMFAFCAHAADYAYVFGIGGRPVFSWPAYIVPSLSCGLLCGGLAAFLAMLVLNRLPRLNHPVFNIPGIGRASVDRYFVVLSHPRAAPDVARAEQVFGNLAAAPLAIHRVPR